MEHVKQYVDDPEHVAHVYEQARNVFIGLNYSLLTRTNLVWSPIVILAWTANANITR